MTHLSPALALARLRAVWDAEVGPPSRRALWVAFLAATLGGAHIARIGVPAARITAIALAVIPLLALLARPFVLRARRTPKRIVADTLQKTDAAIGGATLRALGLVDRVREKPSEGSLVLAELHVAKLTSKVPLDHIADRAARSGARWSIAGLAAAVLALGAVVLEPIRVVEGLDVLAARKKEAPLRLAWVDDVDMQAIPPEYLRLAPRRVFPFTATALPRGTTLRVSARPLRSRTLVLTDGTRDVAFVDDGGGRVVARWVLGDSTSIAIAARFGDVYIRQADEQAVTSIPDEAPKVIVEGAPRTVRLLDEPSIPIHYQATDDHGLREVNLVLRAGTREEHRALSRPAADATSDRGGYELKAKDAFFKRTYTPVEVTVEARDNDTVAGPKWGKSPAIVVIPPEAGEPEALRFTALVEARGALVDLLATRLRDAKIDRDHPKNEAEAQSKALAKLTSALAGSYGGIGVAQSFTRLARGQMRRLGAALAAEQKAPSAATHQKLLAETEHVVLAFDIGVRMLGARDARSVALRLAEVAEELASALTAMDATTGADRAAAERRADAATSVLTGGGKQLLRLGELGVDLGEIVGAYMRRVARARDAADLRHAALAAEDLAARLKRPDPSFSGGGGHGGVETGGSPSPGNDGESSGADQEMQAIAKELEDLAREHASWIDEVEEQLDRAISKEELDAIKEEAKRHAQSIRDAVKNLPEPGGDPSSAEAAAGAARDEAEAMAAALEAGRLREAVEAGKNAGKKLDNAKKLGQEGGVPREERAGREAAAAKPTLDKELAWAEDLLKKMRSDASSRAKEGLSKAGKAEQRLAERAKDLAQKGKGGDGALPDDMLERLNDASQAMRDAQQSLEKGDGEHGLRLQRDAQRLLDMAKGDGEGKQSRERESDQEGDKGLPSRRKTEIPGKNAHKGPEDFRRRVLEGLGQSSDPRHKDAIKRYAEGLLK